jgi:N-acyl-D-aspartate/D-glutamate deacylase
MFFPSIAFESLGKAGSGGARCVWVYFSASSVMMPDRSLHCFLLLFLSVVVFPVLAHTQEDSTLQLFDVVISNGRVLDPERRLDSVLNIGVANGTICILSNHALSGRRIVDASGLVVAPGFIDIMSYDPIEPGVWNKISDGVTTALAMHGGTAYPTRWYAAFAGQKPPIHYGASFFYAEARLQFIKDRYRPAPPDALTKLRAIAEDALRNGALGISFALEYIPGTSSDEILPLMELASQYDVPVFFHARYSDMEEPGTNIDALNEIIGYARATRAAVHVDHINSTGGTFSMHRSLAMIDSARAEGIDITACMYPYTYWGTYLNSARFDPGWQERFHISYNDLQLGGSSERLTAKSFQKFRRLGKLAVAYAIPDEDNRAALLAPYVMIGSDAVLEPDHNNHPRASGCFSRTIAVYVHDLHVISLLDAVAKMTILPAHRLERAAPAMKRKGRIQVGADADIVVFDPNRIRDRATVEHPELESEGIQYVMVAGRLVKDPDGLHKHIRAGRAVRGSVRTKK